MESLSDGEFVSSVLGALPDPVLVVGAAGVIDAVNDRARSFFKMDLRGQHLSLAMRSPAVLLAFDEAITGGKSANVQHTIRGTPPQVIDVFVSPLTVAQGRARHALVVLRDLTREQQIERMRADFVANASHELRTPLASLTGFIETMQGAAKNDEAARAKFLEHMKTQADRMGRLIDDLLSLSRIEIGEHVGPTARADLSAIAAQVRDLLMPQAKAANCDIRLQVPQSLAVIGDADQLTQAVHNLVENAIKYASSGKHIDLRGRIEDDFAILEVIDHGPGIAAQHVPRLTERFYRADVQDSRTRGGTGLGLAIVKHIVNRHRGKLVVESVVGQGSRFKLQLPEYK